MNESAETEGAHHSLIGKEIPKGVMVLRIFGAIFFGAADQWKSALKRIKQEPDDAVAAIKHPPRPISCFRNTSSDSQAKYALGAALRVCRQNMAGSPSSNFFRVAWTIAVALPS